MQTQQSKKSRRVRTGYYSEVTRDKAFGLSMDQHQPQKRRVYALLIHKGKLTRHQIAGELNLPLHVICARVKDLMNDNYVIDTSETIINPDTNTPNNLVKAVEKELELFSK